MLHKLDVVINYHHTGSLRPSAWRIFLQDDLAGFVWCASVCDRLVRGWPRPVLVLYQLSSFLPPVTKLIFIIFYLIEL